MTNFQIGVYYTFKWIMPEFEYIQYRSYFFLNFHWIDEKFRRFKCEYVEIIKENSQ